MYFPKANGLFNSSDNSAGRPKLNNKIRLSKHNYSFAENGHMGPKRQAAQCSKKNKDITSFNTLKSFPRSTTLFAVQQGVLELCNRFSSKGP